MPDQTSEPITEIWYSPRATSLKVGTGDPSPDIVRIADPWDCLRFVGGFLTLDPAGEHYAEQRQFLDVSAAAYGLRQVSPADRAALEKPLTFTDSEWEAMAARRAGTRK
jgi:hypothetical protein